VIAGCLDDKGEGANILRKWSDSGRIHVVKLDVRSDTSVEELVEFTKRHTVNGMLMC